MEQMSARDADLHQFGSEGQRTYEGYIGEAVVERLLKEKDLDTRNFDFTRNGLRYDVKTISCSGRPQKDYLATVNSCDRLGQSKQKTDRYVFVRLLNDYSVAWVVGWIEAEAFWKKGIFVRKGQSLFPGQIAQKANCTVLPIRELNDIELLLGGVQSELF